MESYSSCVKLMANDGGALSLKEFHKEVGRFIYENATDVDTIQTDTLTLSSQLKLRHRFGQNNTSSFPTCEDLNGWILQDFVKHIQLYASYIKKSWENSGCSILLDGWDDEENEKSLINIFVTCPKGTIYLRSADMSEYSYLNLNGDSLQTLLEEVVAEIGVKNVVQIISHCATPRMQELGKKFMDEYHTIFWTVSAPYCIQLMVKKLEMMVPFEDTLRKAKTITRFVHGHPLVLNLLRDQTSTHDLVKPQKVEPTLMTFLTIENMVFEKSNLQKLFLSSAWKSTNLASSSKEGRMVSQVVSDPTFWAGAVFFLKVVAPLNRVLQDFYMIDEPDLGYIYEIIDQVKESMRKELRNNESIYMQIWDAIDDIWNQILHSPIHAAAYFLNPKLFYSNDFYLDSEVVNGVLVSIQRMVKDDFTKISILEQIPMYKKGRGGFGDGIANLKSSTYTSPVAWWSEYGKECPDLQMFAIRILSQTCNGAAKFHLKRSMAERLHHEGRNHIQKQCLTDLTFVHYNLSLQKIESNPKDGTTFFEEDDKFYQDWTQYVESAAENPVNLDQC